MMDKHETEEAIESLGCAAVVAFFAAALTCCIAVGMALGAEWGVAGTAFVIAAFGVLMRASAKNAKHRMRDGDGDES